MSESVNLPALGESVTEGTVTRWLKKVGDRVEVDEPLVEVSTDKVDTEIPSPVAGILEAILVAEDETVDVGTPLATVGDGSGASAEPTSPAAADAEPAAAEPAAAEPVPAYEAPAAEAPAAWPAAPEAPAAEAPTAEAPTAPEAPVSEAPAAEAPAAEAPTATEAPVSEAPAADIVAEPSPVAQAPVDEVAPPTQASPAPETAAPSATSTPSASSSTAGYVTPLVRKLAHESGIDLSTISGSGIGGRIRKQDVITAATDSSTPATPGRKALETSALRGTTVPMSRLRKVVAERAVISMQSSAQLTTVVEVDVTAVASFRDAVKAEFLEKTGNKLSFLPFFTLAAAEALKAYPIINATIDGESIVYPSQENISMAVDTERGLLTPVIRDAGDMNIAELAGQIADLANRTRNNQLKPDELAGGTFTVTNTGSRGALFDTPVVFLPQSAILGTGIVTKKPVVVTDNGLDAIAIRSMAFLALSYDHRIVDGADAARFLVAVKERLEGGDFRSVLGI
ncbi:MAG: 2-oxo acid dehydrogenase subunit E2 [Terrimesophilobacter sp.]